MVPGRLGIGWVTILGLAGCTAPSVRTENDVPPAVADFEARNDVSSRPKGVVVPMAYQQPATPSTPSAATSLPSMPTEEKGELTAQALVQLVLARNPTLEQMTAAAAAAAARFPQSTSLDDPAFTFWTAPGSAGSPNVDYAARIELTQKFLYPGKRGLKGQVAAADATAAARDVDDARLQLAEAAVVALADYDLAVQSLELAGENLRLLEEFRRNAEARYKTGQAPQQDLLQAEVELARQEERLVSARRGRQVAVARLNTLLHQPPDFPLPPPAEFIVGEPLPDSATLRTAALATRPDLKALAARVGADHATLALAVKEYNPDVEVMAAYDGYWQGATGRPLQWQVGTRVNLPIRLERRDGAVTEARARVAQRRAELTRLVDQINLQVQEAYEQTQESDQIVELYRSKVLPAAAANVKEAQAGYVTGRVPFLNLVEAQRSMVELRERYYGAAAEATRRRAALDRAVGILAGGPARS